MELNINVSYGTMCTIICAQAIHLVKTIRPTTQSLMILLKNHISRLCGYLLSPGSKCFLHPYTAQPGVAIKHATLDPTLVILEETILWVHQEPWKQELLLKYLYGNTITLMDVTYKTTRYDLPLFFASV